MTCIVNFLSIIHVMLKLIGERFGLCRFDLCDSKHVSVHLKVTKNISNVFIMSFYQVCVHFLSALKQTL